MVMKSAEDGHRYDAACVLDGAMDRSILLERLMRSQLVIQLNNITPTGPKSGKFCIAGIRGLVGGSSFTR
jgi:hypothetical protein